jgi:hypothetical protein
MFGLMGKSETCVDCKAHSPKLEPYALMGTEHRWRVTRSKRPDGSLLLEWRCPSCWSVHKQSKPEVATALAAPPRSRAGRQSFRDPTAPPRRARPPNSGKLRRPT